MVYSAQAYITLLQLANALAWVKDVWNFSNLDRYWVLESITADYTKTRHYPFAKQTGYQLHEWSGFSGWLPAFNRISPLHYTEQYMIIYQKIKNQYTFIIEICFIVLVLDHLISLQKQNILMVHHRILINGMSWENIVTMILN